VPVAVYSALSAANTMAASSAQDREIPDKIMVRQDARGDLPQDRAREQDQPEVRQRVEHDVTGIRGRRDRDLVGVREHDRPVLVAERAHLGP
jgi:hypothetical protein